MGKMNLILVFCFIGITISSINLEWEEHQKSVLLKWNTNSSEIPEEIEIYRQKINSSWELIAKLNSTETQFEDKKVYTIYDYYYRVTYITKKAKIESNEVLAHCVKTCTIEGRILENWVKGIPDVDVCYEEYDSKSREQKCVKTDKNGHYKIEGLPYFKGTYAHYVVYPILPDNYTYSQYERSMIASFDADYNYVKLSDLCLVPKKNKFLNFK